MNTWTDGKNQIVFENFRNKCLDIDKLDPAYFLSAPGLSWQSGLKMTGQTLELLTDENMLLLFEKGIRGGICEAITKYKKANNKYMKKTMIRPKQVVI